MGALPAGWVDTGETAYLTFSASAQLLDLQDFSPPHNVVFRVTNAVSVDEWRLEKANFAQSPCFIPPTFTTPGEQQQWNIQVSGTGLTTTVKESQVFGTCHPLSARFNSGTYGFTYTAGPFRLGMRYYEAAGGPRYPAFAKDYEAEYCWFSDETTAIDVTFAGVTATTRYWRNGSTTPPAAGVHQEGDLGAFSFGITSNTTAGATVFQKITSLTVQGSTVDTSDLSTGELEGQGSGEVWGMGGTDAASAAPPWVLVYDLDVLKNGGGSTGCEVDTVNVGTVTMPYSATHTFRNVSWAASDLTAAYEALQIPAP